MKQKIRMRKNYINCQKKLSTYFPTHIPLVLISHVLGKLRGMVDGNFEKKKLRSTMIPFGESGLNFFPILKQ